MRKIEMKRERVYFVGTTAIIFFAMAIVWFLTPAPTVVARYVWDEYRAGALALALDRADAALAFSIGTYYFGSPPASAIDEDSYDPARAERAFRKAIALNPSLPLVHYMLARIEFIRADFSAALADLNTELALNPAYTRTRYMRALVYAYRGLPGDLLLAEADFRAVIDWAPSEWAGYNDLAFVLAKEKKYADAAAVLKEGIAKASGGHANPWLWNTLGVMELNLQEYSVALASLENARLLAETLTEHDWQRAYPGNDPALATDGLKAMKDGIVRNIAAVRAALGT